MPTVNARKVHDVSAVLRAAREDAGLSQVELATRLAFSRDYMIDLESGKGSVYTSRLFRALHELGITVTLTYGDDDAKP